MTNYNEDNSRKFWNYGLTPYIKLNYEMDANITTSSSQLLSKHAAESSA